MLKYDPYSTGVFGTLIMNYQICQRAFLSQEKILCNIHLSINFYNF